MDHNEIKKCELVLSTLRNKYKFNRRVGFSLVNQDPDTALAVLTSACSDCMENHSSLYTYLIHANGKIKRKRIWIYL